MDSTASSASKTHVSSLPPQLLAVVLARVEPAERLCTMARVCSAWRAAAVIATNSISARGLMWCGRRTGIRQPDASALSGWLQAHAAAAALDSLAVQGDRFTQRCAVLQLPVQQLASLRSLDLEHTKVAVQGEDNTPMAPLDLPPALSSITRLRLWHVVDVGLGTLPAFTNLRHLVLAHYRANSTSPELSGLLQLTHLHLAYAQDAVLASVSGLTSLQELEVGGTFYTNNGLAALPTSLTKLCVSGGVTLAPDSTPAVAQLTALRWLDVNNADGFSTAVLCSMSSLQHLAVLLTPLLQAASAGDEDSEDAVESDDEEAMGVDLSVFSGLPQLQHLELPGRSSRHAAAGTDAEVAALTASSQLTCLNIERLVEQEHYRKIFPEGRRLPQLQELRATMGLLGRAEDVEAMVQCCPNLERLQLTAAMRGEPVLDDFNGEEHDWCSVEVLASLRSLTRLAINVSGPGAGLQDRFECAEVFWRSMAELTSLGDLYINDLNMEQFGGIVELTSCQQLTRLKIDDAADCCPDFEMETPEDQPPDIWRRLPQEALQAALQYYKNNLDYPQGALRSLAWAAAQHSLELDVEVRGEVAELRATVAGLHSRLQLQDERLQLQDARLKQQDARLQQRDEQLQQQEQQLQVLAGLQATVAAMGAQLQALQPQNGMAQGRSGIAG